MGIRESIENLLRQARINIDETQFDEAEKIALEVLKYCEEKEEFKRSRCEALLAISEAYIRQGKSKEALPHTEEGLALAQNLGDGKLEAFVHRNLSFIFELHSDFPTAIRHLETALVLWEHVEYSPGIAMAYGNLGNLYNEISNYDTALTYYRKALEVSRKLRNEEGIAVLLGNIGLIYWQLGDFSLALEYYNQALQLNEKLGVQEYAAINLSNIGIVYFDLDDYPRAMEFYQKSLAIYTEKGLRDKMGKNLGNIGNVYVKLKDYPTALEYLQKAVSIFEEIGSETDVAINLEGIGSAYFFMEDFALAIEYIKRALAIYERLDIKSGIISVYDNFTKILSKQGHEEYNPSLAKEYLLKMLPEAEAIGKKNNLKSYHEQLATLYSLEEEWKSAFEHHTKFHLLKQEIQSEEVEKQARKFAVERQIAVMEKEQEILKIKNEELAEKNIQLEQLNAEKNEFLGIAAHDLKNPLNAIQMLATILREDAGVLSEDEIREFSGDIHSSSKRMFDLIVNLLDINRIERGMTLTDIEIFSAEIAVRTVIDRYIESAKIKGIELLPTFSEHTLVETSATTCIQVLENLISNAVKYSPHNRKVFVTVEKLG